MFGKVKWFADEKGYGFIKGDDRQDAFVHHTAIEGPVGERRTLSDGQRVEYEVERAPKGPRATWVRPVIEEVVP